MFFFVHCEKYLVLTFFLVLEEYFNNLKNLIRLGSNLKNLFHYKEPSLAPKMLKILHVIINANEEPLFLRV